MELTLKEAVENHRKMWNWIADKTEKIKCKVEKQDYFVEHGIKEEEIPDCGCYACEYALINRGRRAHCDSCFLIWQKEDNHCLNSIYGKYTMLRSKEWRTGADLAQQIANLPLKPNFQKQLDEEIAAERKTVRKITCAKMGTFDCYVKVPGITSCDRCLATEIKMLNDLGIQTIGCCCGHGEADAYIQVDPKYIDKMKELGYEEIPLNEHGHGKWCFYPKSILLSQKEDEEMGCDNG